MNPFTEAQRQEFLAAKHVGVLSVDAAGGRPSTGADFLQLTYAMAQQSAEGWRYSMFR
jgi:hypothetical protein